MNKMTNIELMMHMPTRGMRYSMHFISMNITATITPTTTTL